MPSNNESGILHKQAASDLEESAQYHRKAAEYHDQNKHGEAKDNSKSAKDCCNKAQKHSEMAHESSSK